MVDAVKTFKKDRDVTKNSAEHRCVLVPMLCVLGDRTFSRVWFKREPNAV